MHVNDDNLSQFWHEARNIQEKPTMDLELIKSKAGKHRNKINKLLFLNVLIMGVTLSVLIWFFTDIARLKDTISHWGIGLMIGGLAIRIILEVISYLVYKQIDLSLDALNSNHTYLRYYTIRKWIQKPFTIFILVCYTLGFHLLIPEFSLYFQKSMISFFLVSYWIGTVIYSWSIYRAVKKEALYYKELVEINNQIIND